MMLCSRSALSHERTKVNPSVEEIACLTFSSQFPLKPVFVMLTKVALSSRAVKIHSTVVGVPYPSHSTRMRLCSSMAKTLTWVEASYISHSHWTCLSGSNLPLPLVNQNFEVIAGLINASKTSATGLRISIAVFATGICVSWRFSIDLFLSNDELLLTSRSC